MGRLARFLAAGLLLALAACATTPRQAGPQPVAWSDLPGWSGKPP